MKPLVYTVRIEPVEEGGFFVSVPALPGCFTEGKTYEEAIAMAEDVIKLWAETLIENGQPVPEEPVPAAASTATVLIETAAAKGGLSH